MVRDGRWHLPVTRGWSSVDDDAASAYLVASNELTISPGWDRPALGALLEGLAERRGPDILTGTGYDRESLNDLLESLKPEPEPPVALCDPDEVPEPPAEPVTKRGDLWLLGAYIECPSCGHHNDVPT